MTRRNIGKLEVKGRLKERGQGQSLGRYQPAAKWARPIENEVKSHKPSSKNVD